MNTEYQEANNRGYLPKHQKWEIPKPYNLPVHDQGNENSCTAHSFATLMEYQLSIMLQERTLVDAEDLWNKQKKYGSATADGDSLEGPWIICEKYGIRFRTEGGKTGSYFLNRSVAFDG